MLSFVFISFFLLLTMSLSAQQPDSSKMMELGGKLSEYYRTLEQESVDVQKQECDFLIESTSDSLLRQFVATDIYRHYRDSKIMGSENVAVHVFDRWFAPGVVRMESDADFYEARRFADFNRMSLIGESAPQVFMETIDGRTIGLFGSDDAKGRFRVLYFYDTDCSKCRIESALLENLLKPHDFPVDLYAVYVGDDRNAWEKYVSQYLEIDGAVHLWDPALDSDFQRKYGIQQTPRLFLTGPDGVILGRGLDVQALEELLVSIFMGRPLEYGTRESEALFDGIFAMSSGAPSVGEVKGIADYIADRTIERGDTLMFRQMAGDYLYYLASHAGEGYKEGLRYHMDTNIFSHDVWRSDDDSLKVIGFARIMDDLLDKAVPGTRLPAVKVSGELYTWRGKREVNKRLDKLGGRDNIIIFYTEGCEVCAAEKQAALSLLHAGTAPSDRELKVFMVNVDRLMASDPGLADRLMDAFDLSSLPHIILSDSKGIVNRRYVSLLQ